MASSITYIIPIYPHYEKTIFSIICIRTVKYLYNSKRSAKRF